MRQKCQYLCIRLKTNGLTAVTLVLHLPGLPVDVAVACRKVSAGRYNKPLGILQRLGNGVVTRPWQWCYKGSVMKL